MNLFLRRIPANTKHTEITDFVSPALNRGFFRKSGRIINVEILALQDIRVGTIEYHGLVTLDSDAATQNAAKTLKNRRLNGRLVVVRPYYHRSWYNDPRQQHHAETLNFIEKRRSDRRRGKYLQVIKNVSDRFNSEDDFFSTISHQQFLITFLVPGEIEATIEKAITDFNAQQSSNETAHASKHKPVRLLMEQDGSQKIFSFQLHAEKKDSLALLEKLKTEFPGSGIQYWIMPVVEKGEI